MSSAADRGIMFPICSTYPGAEIRLSIEPEFFNEQETVISVREWFETMDGEWVPTRKGINFPYTLESMTNLLIGLLSVSSVAETQQHIILNLLEELQNAETGTNKEG